MPKKRILVAPLNWGLGHSTRCIPIINELIRQNFEPVIASDGVALKLLQKEFPDLEYHELPKYNISYSRKEAFFKLKLLLQTPKIITAIKNEKKVVEKLIRSQNISGIISDNRWGVRSKKIPSVFISHQLKVLSGSSTFISSKIQQKLISKFTECWVPDFEDIPNLSGEMGHLDGSPFPIKYIGPLSRFSKRELPIKYKYAIILSGPEPQRGILEQIILNEFENCVDQIVIVRGVVEDSVKKKTIKNLTIYNYLLAEKLEEVLNSCEFIICRSGYSSIMDLAKLRNKAFLIPTPGQPEQEYLAKSLKNKKMVASCGQKKFSIKKLEELNKTSGLSFDFLSSNFSSVFRLFQGK